MWTVLKISVNIQFKDDSINKNVIVTGDTSVTSKIITFKKFIPMAVQTNTLLIISQLKK